MVAAGATGHAVVVAPQPVAGPRLPAVSRRKVLLIGFWTGMGAMLLGIVTTILNSLYRRNVAKLTGIHPTGFTMDTLKPGDKQAISIQVPDVNDPLIVARDKGLPRSAERRAGAAQPRRAGGNDLRVLAQVPAPGLHRAVQLRRSRSPTRGATRRTRAGSAARATARPTATPA